MAINWPAVLLVAWRLLGWGLVTTGGELAEMAGLPAEPFGMGSKTDGAWAYANVGVFVAFAVGFVGWLVLGRSVVRRQEAAGVSA